MAEDIEALRALFTKTYAAIPTKLRSDIIALVGEKPYNWDSAYLEVRGETQIGDGILRHLEEMGVLQK